MILALFFTRGVSLETWLVTGLFGREKLIYEEYLRRGYLKAVYWLTYGSQDAKVAKDLYAKKRLHPGIQVIPMPQLFRGRFGAFTYSFLMPVIQKAWLKRADFYKTNQMNGSWSAVLAKCLYRKPLIVRTGYTLSIFEERLNGRRSRIVIYRLIERLVYRKATCVVVTSKKDKKHISNLYKKPEKDITVIPNFIDTGLFKPQKREKYTDRIIFVGRLSEQKNIFNLILATAKSGLTLDIYGNGELWDALQIYTREQGARVNFMGTVPNSKLPDILNSYQYYVLPSYLEGMPKTLLEAMACGLVCIGTDVEGINEVIEDGVNGVLAKGTDADSLAEAIQNLIHDSQLQNRLRHSAFQTILDNFSMESVLAQEWRLWQLLRLACGV